MRRISFDSVSLVLGALLVAGTGCGSSSKAGGAGGAMTSAVDKSRCNDSGKQVAASDTNGDKKPDVVKLYAKGRDSAQTLVCKQVDLNHDGKMDIVYHYDDTGALAFEEFDLDFDDRFDLRAFYQGGRKVREEMDTNYDQKVDFTKYYESDRLVRIERDGNSDGRVDEWMYYEAGRLDRIGYDTTGSGRVDKWERAPEGDVGSEPAPAAGGAQPASGTVPPSSTATTPGGTSGPGGPGSSVGAPTTPPTSLPTTVPPTPPPTAPR